MGLNVVYVNFFYSTFANVYFLFVTFLRFLTFLKICFERFFTSMGHDTEFCIFFNIQKLLNKNH